MRTAQAQSDAIERLDGRRVLAQLDLRQIAQRHLVRFAIFASVKPSDLRRSRMAAPSCSRMRFLRQPQEALALQAAHDRLLQLLDLERLRHVVVGLRRQCSALSIDGKP